MPDINRDPVRKIALPFVAGDPWAQVGAQVPIPDSGSTSVQRLTITGGLLQWRAIAYDGLGPTAQPVDGDATTVDMAVVVLRKDRRGNTTLARLVPVVAVPVGEQITEVDVSPHEIVCLGVVTSAQDGAAAIWIFVDAGAKLTAGSRGTA